MQQRRLHFNVARRAEKCHSHVRIVTRVKSRTQFGLGAKESGKTIHQLASAGTLLQVLEALSVERDWESGWDRRLLLSMHNLCII